MDQQEKVREAIKLAAKDCGKINLQTRDDLFVVPAMCLKTESVLDETCVTPEDEDD